MESSGNSLRKLDQIALEDTITAIDSCHEYVAVGCLDDTAYVWQRDKESKQIKLTDHINEEEFRCDGDSGYSFQQQINSFDDKLYGFYYKSILTAFSQQVQHLEQMKTIQCDVMENWKADCYQESIMTGGDSGKITFFDITSKEKGKTVKMGDIFITGIAKAKKKPFIASGNNNGQVHLAIMEEKQKVIDFNNHNKIVRDLCFVDDDTKLLSAADDSAIKMVDIASEKVSYSFEAHKLGVTAITSHVDDSRIFFSTGFDKYLKTWDTRNNTCVGSTLTASPLWDVRSLGNTVVTGGDSGSLFLYSME